MRKDKLLENSETASFHLTALGSGFAEVVASTGLQESFEKTLEQYLRLMDNAQADAATKLTATEVVPISAPPTEPEQQVEAEAEPDTVSPVPCSVRFLLGEELRTKENITGNLAIRALTTAIC